MVAFFCKIPIKEILLYPFGGISKFDMDLNAPSFLEFVLLIMGPIFQCFGYFFLIFCFPEKMDFIRTYHLSIFFFNLLPIYPLDGGKLFLLFLEKIFPYRLSFFIVLFCSYALLGIWFFFCSSYLLNTIGIFLLLLFFITREYQRIDIFYQKFLLERYLKNYSFSSCFLINHENSFYRGKRHLLRLQNEYYLEKDFLKKKYKND